MQDLILYSEKDLEKLSNHYFYFYKPGKQMGILSKLPEAYMIHLNKLKISEHILTAYSFQRESEIILLPKKLSSSVTSSNPNKINLSILVYVRIWVLQFLFKLSTNNYFPVGIEENKIPLWISLHASFWAKKPHIKSTTPVVPVYNDIFEDSRFFNRAVKLFEEIIGPYSVERCIIKHLNHIYEFQECLRYVSKSTGYSTVESIILFLILVPIIPIRDHLAAISKEMKEVGRGGDRQMDTYDKPKQEGNLNFFVKKDLLIKELIEINNKLNSLFSDLLTTDHQDEFIGEVFTQFNPIE
jgi:hypothetical protein